MKGSSIVTCLVLLPAVSAWASSRRALLKKAATTAVLVAAPLPSRAGLLDDFGTDPGKIVQKEKVETVAVANVPKGEMAIDPTLRASYYYPTAKKRYLPRILKVSNSIPSVATSLNDEQWDSVQEFFKDADNAVLPMKLYVSSLDGQGLGMANSYAMQMKGASDKYEQLVGQLKKAISSQNKDAALAAVTNMGVVVTEYRQAGRLTDDDGNIPSVDEMRRMAMRKPTVAIAQKF